MDGINYADIAKPYNNQWELIQDLLVELDTRLYSHYKYHEWLGERGEFQEIFGTHATREEFENVLTRVSRLIAPSNLSAQEEQQLKDQRTYIKSRLSKTELLNITDLFLMAHADAFQENCIILALAVEVDMKYRRLFAFLQEDGTKVYPTIQFACELFSLPGEVIALKAAQFFENNDFVRIFDKEGLKKGILKLGNAAVSYVMERPQVGLEYPKPSSEKPIVHINFIRKLGSYMKSNRLISLEGEPHSGRKFIVKYAAKLAKKKLALCKLKGENISKSVREGMMWAALNRGCICFYNVEEIENLDELRMELKQFKRDCVVIVCCGSKAHLSELRLILPEVTEDDRINMLYHLTDGWNIPVEEISAKYAMQPPAIAEAVKYALERALLGEVITSSLFLECCQAQSTHNLDKLATKVKHAYSWEHLVLPEDQIRLMRKACGYITNHYQVYTSWGFDKVMPYGRGLSVLFAGPSGTGKTMSAQVIAKELGMEMYKLQISQVVSKYIGETEKNLKAVFDEAKKCNCILFFDECDALFGKRSEVSDAQDRYANVETAYLLQQMEEYEGVTILSTNLLQNIDEAFMRRIKFILRFPLPNAQLREQMYKKMLPHCAPTQDDINFKFVAERFNLSGGSIKNIVFDAAFMAAAEQVPIGMTHILRACIEELRKNDIMVLPQDLAEYANIIF